MGKERHREWKEKERERERSGKHVSEWKVVWYVWEGFVLLQEL